MNAAAALAKVRRVTELVSFLTESTANLQKFHYASEKRGLGIWDWGFARYGCAIAFAT